MSDVKRCPCRGSNEMCGCQNGPHPVRQDPEAEITALRARLESVEKERDAWKNNSQGNAAAMNCVEEAVGQILPVGVRAGSERGPEPVEWVADIVAALHKVKARAERAEAALATARRDAHERAAQVADAHLDRLPNYTCPDNECADQVEQGYGNACINIAHSIRALANEAPE